jgi:hypothetical protein
MKDIYFPKLAGQLADLYLEWWNDWLTLERFAEYQGVSVDDAEALINMGRQYHDQRAARIKEVEAAQRDNDTGITLRGASEAHDQAKAEMVHEALPCPPIPNLETGDIMRVHDDFYLNRNQIGYYQVQHKFEYMGQYGSVEEAMNAIDAKIAEVEK